MAKPNREGTVVNPDANKTKAVPSKLDALETDPVGDYGVLEYPVDILDRSGHFIMFHIVESIPGSGSVEPVQKAQALKMAQSANLAGQAGAALGGFLGQVAGIVSTVGVPGVLKNLSSSAKQLDAAKNIIAGGIKRAEATRLALIGQGASTSELTSVRQKPFKQRTVQTIVLYMPEKITTAYGFDYQGESLQVAAAGAGLVELTGDILSGATTLDEAAKSELIAALAEQYGTKMAAKFVDELGSLVGAQVGARAFVEKNRRRVVNPHMQFLFRAVNQRTFNYTFSMVPKSPEESQAIDNIVRTLKYFSHPEVLLGGRFHGYPAEFDIQYYSREVDQFGQVTMVENDWLNRIGRCYLSNISVDYTGSGVMSAHKNLSSPVPESLQGETSQTRAGNPPTHVTLALTFNELETLNRKHIKEGF